MAISDTMGKMVGPLPLGAWVAIVGVAGGYGYWRSQNGGVSAEESEPVPDAYGNPAVGTGAVGGGTWIDMDPPETPATSTAPADNDAWGSLAMTWFQANNYDMAKAGQAVAQYLSGTLATADVAGWAMVRTVMMHIGAPPQIIQSEQPVPNKPTVPVTKPPATTPKPAPKPAPKPKPKPKPKPSKRYYTVRPGDNLTKIARKYKGMTWQKIYNANRSKIKNPNLIYPGWKLIIPN